MRFLFVVDMYLPKPIATGICVLHVQEALLRYNVKSDVVTLADRIGLIEQNQYGNVFGIPGNIIYEEKRSSTLKKKIRSGLQLLTWPILHPVQVVGYRKVIEKLNDRYHYDAIFGVGLPFETVLASVGFKNNYIYQLDALSNNPVYNRGITRVINHRTKWVEKYFYKRTNKVFHLKSTEPYYRQRRFKKFQAKFEYVDVPHLVETGSGVTGKTNETIKMIYSGALFTSFRSPEYAIELIKKVNETIPVQCDFYTRGDCEGIIQEAEKDTDAMIRSCGFVDLDTITRETDEADILLSIGNTLKEKDYSLPSKVISYLATGKPIIHIDGGNNDSAKAYLKKYPLALVIDPKADVRKNAMKIREFIISNIGKRVPFETVRQTFFQNTPDYTARRMIETVRNSHRGTDGK